MPANVGEMFYYGEMPWHGEGTELAKPATMDKALREGGLNWKVGEVDIQTCDDPPSPAPTRKAIVRLDRPPGHDGRVLGVVHRGFRPLQNRHGALLFDAIFGGGKPVYHTGGYLGDGQVVWLLAKIDKQLTITEEDVLEPYALFANSHDGSRAFSISLTIVRVVCQNTLTLALQKKGMGEKFRRAHESSFWEHAEAAQLFWRSVMKQLDGAVAEFAELTEKKCEENSFENILGQLLPMPTKPRNTDRNPRLRKIYETKVANILEARKQIKRLRKEGKGAEIEGAKGTFWGALNAVIEYIDHHKEIKGSRVSYALLGDGMDLKVKAYRLIQDRAKEAA